MVRNDLSLVLTTRCNFKCKHCLREYYDKPVEPDLKLLKKILFEAYELGFNHVGITGGEPILYPKFNELIDFLIKNGFTWSVSSNGSMYEQYDDAIKKNKSKLKSIRLSFDGGTEKTHDYIRQKGSYKKLLKALEHYKKMGLKVGISYVVNSTNIKEIPMIVELGLKYKIDYLDFGAIIPAGHNLDLQIEWKDKVKVHKYIQELIKKDLGMRIGFANSLFAVTDSEKFCGLINNHKPVINPYSEYIFCCDTIGRGAVLGDLKKESFSKLYIKGLKKATELKRKRADMIKKKQFFKDFNSCHFCNLIMEKQVKKQKQYKKENKFKIIS